MCLPLFIGYLLRVFKYYMRRTDIFGPIQKKNNSASVTSLNNLMLYKDLISHVTFLSECFLFFFF